ncbi:hypothetical protein GQ53DRAFT_837257 [Thozetella sp. PMI_491]|nr:hypothetical protein GQ53DRAFT_837257 [Thozetella sp. PMI_491]
MVEISVFPIAIVEKTAQLVNHIRNRKLDTKDAAVLFKRLISQLIETLGLLGELREKADGLMHISHRVHVLNTEKRGWAVLHDIHRTILALVLDGRQSLLKDFLEGSALRKLRFANEAMVGRIKEVEACRAQLQRITDSHLAIPLRPYSFTPLGTTKSSREASVPLFQPRELAGVAVESELKAIDDLRI